MRTIPVEFVRFGATLWYDHRDVVHPVWLTGPSTRVIAIYDPSATKTTQIGFWSNFMS
jgi:hypothetical protein